MNRQPSSRAAISPNVLFIAPFEPWCRENGSSVVISDLLHGLEAVMPEDSIFTAFLRDPPGGCTRGRAAAFSSVTLGHEPLPKWLSIGAQLLTGRAPWDFRLRYRKVAQLIERSLRAERFSPSLVHVEHLVLVPLGRMLADTFGCPLVYRAHNIESQLWGRRMRLASDVSRRLLRRYEQREADAIDTCDMTLCISDVDRDWVRAHAPRAAADVLPVGLAFERFDNAFTREVPRDPQICFVGGLEWTPNEVGLRWFVEEVLPIVLTRVPDARLAVLARGAATRPWLTANPHVTVLPPSAQPLSLFSASRLSIAPLLEGGGVRVKILESLAVGCPVVATSIGGEGLELPGLTHTNEPGAFAEACLRQLADGNGEIRARAREGVRARHGAEVVAGTLASTWLGLTQERTAAVHP